MYRQDKQFMKNPTTSPSRIYIGNIAESVKYIDLESKFRVHGNILGITLQKGFGFVQFENENQAQSAISKEHGSTLHGRKLNVKPAFENRKGNQNNLRRNNEGIHKPLDSKQQQQIQPQKQMQQQKQTQEQSFQELEEEDEQPPEKKNKIFNEEDKNTLGENVDDKLSNQKEKRENMGLIEEDEVENKLKEGNLGKDESNNRMGEGINEKMRGESFEGPNDRTGEGASKRIGGILTSSSNDRMGGRPLGGPNDRMGSSKDKMEGSNDRIGAPNDRISGGHSKRPNDRMGSGIRGSRFNNRMETQPHFKDNFR